MQTRFPPEPNGYLHIGHAKSIGVNFGIAEDFGGVCNLRFDDTNPETEDQDFVDGIIADIEWLGYEPNSVVYASDYFEQLYLWAESLIERGLAYVDDQDAETISAQRGGFTTPGVDSPYRDRSVDENLALFRGMRAGEFAEGERVLRAKIDMNHENMQMRDPVLYRIRHAHHVRTGDSWVIYPTYDWAHGQSDAIERVTHSLCTLEFDTHPRPLRLVSRQPRASRRTARTDRVRSPEPDPHGHVEAKAAPARRRRQGRRVGRSAHADTARSAPEGLPAGSDSCVRRTHRYRQGQQHPRHRAARVVHPHRAQLDGTSSHGGAASAQGRHHQLARGSDRHARGDQQPRRRFGGHSPGSVLR